MPFSGQTNVNMQHQEMLERTAKRTYKDRWIMQHPHGQTETIPDDSSAIRKHTAGERDAWKGHMATVCRPPGINNQDFTTLIKIHIYTCVKTEKGGKQKRRVFWFSCSLWRC